MAEPETGSIAIDALLRLSLAEGNSVDPAAEPGDWEMTASMSDTVRRAGKRDPALSYAQTLGQTVPREGFVDEAAEVVLTFPFSPEAIAANEAELARGLGCRTTGAVICAMIGVAAVIKEGSREPANTVGVGVGLALLAIAALLFALRPRPAGRQDR